MRTYINRQPCWMTPCMRVSYGGLSWCCEDVTYAATARRHIRNGNVTRVLNCCRHGRFEPTICFVLAVKSYYKPKKRSLMWKKTAKPRLELKARTRLRRRHSPTRRSKREPWPDISSVSATRQKSPCLGPHPILRIQTPP